MIPLSVPKLDGNEWKYIKECLDTGWVSSVGKYVEKFEEAVAHYVGCKYGVACVNGTSALHAAFVALDLKPNEEVVIPALTFVAPANAVRYCGAYPVFLDVERNYWQLDPQKLKDFLFKECLYKNKRLINKHTNRALRGITVVHLLGHPVDMDPILDLANRFGLWVIEDSAESIGAIYKKRKVGTMGSMGCFSFNGNKVITSGGGGMLTTNNSKLAEKVRYLTTQAKDDSVEYVHHQVGYNYRLTNIQAALGLAQMEQLDQYLKIKIKIASRYTQGLKNIPGLRLPLQAPWAKSIWWLYTILIDKKVFGQGSRELMKVLHTQGIQTRPLWHPLHRLQPFEDSYAYEIIVADYLSKEALSLPSSVGLTENDQKLIIKTLRKKL